MYKEHPSFEAPENKSSKVWRYMDFTKFVSLLQKESLYFARADKFDDTFEGSFSKYNVQNRHRLYPFLSEGQLNSISNIRKNLREYIFLNCWHLNENESAAMWKIYSNNNEGIVIQSSFENLCKSFDKCTNRDISIGKVKYADYNKDWIPEHNLLESYLHKRKSFAHEQEIRAIILQEPPSRGKDDKGFPEIDFSITNFNNGHYIPIDIEILIEKIYISPTSPEWFKELVTLIIEKYSLNKDVKKSSLSDDPVF